MPASAGARPFDVRGRHRRAAIAAAVVLAALNGACTGGTAGTGPVDTRPPRAQRQALAVAVGEDPFLRPLRVPGPRQAPVTAADLGLRSGGPNPGIFETLTRLTPTFGLQPGLAVRWREDPPTGWRFELRRDVVFHDGTALRAGAVVDMLERLANRQVRPRGLEPGSATAVDDHTVAVDLASPNRRLPEQLADPGAGVVAPGTRAGGGADRASTPTGTGPFRFVAYTPGEQLRVAAFEGYRGGRPQLDELTFLFGPEDDASRRLATREALVVGHVDTELLARVGRVDRYAESDPVVTAFLLLNVTGSGPWATLREEAVRRAVALAIDRDALVTEAWRHHGVVSSTVVPPAVLGAAAASVAAPPLDRQAAQAALDAAGWTPGADGVRVRDGERLGLSLIVGRDSRGLDTAAAVLTEQLAGVGIAVERLEPGDAPVDRFARINAATFDLFLDLRGQTDGNPCALCRLFSIRPGGQLTIAGSVGAGERADALYDAAHEQASIGSARRAAAALMTVVVADEVVAVPLVALPHVWALSPRVEGFEPAPTAGTQRWDGVWLSL